ncbi:MAG: hypothetical protein DBX47_06320 [Clostridiales bacterium]|nr:MAG: hypothetical protein DBX47_06320 [Clostridiales bacterium]
MKDVGNRPVVLNMDFRKLRFMKNSRILSRFAAIFLSVALVTVTCLVYDMVIYAMETVQSEAVTDGRAARVIDIPEATDGSEVNLQKLSLNQNISFDGENDPYIFSLNSISSLDELPELNVSQVPETSEVDASGQTPESSDIDKEVERITYKTVVESEVIPCKYTEVPIVYAAFSGKYSDIAAKDGKKEITKRQKYIDGVLSDEVVVSEKITVKPVNGVKYVDKRSLINYGSGAPTEYSRKLDIKFTAYTYGEVGGSVTATGEKTRVGYVAVDKNLIPLHSLLYVVTDNGFVYGYCYAKDTGGGIVGNRIDLFLPSVADMREFGVRTGTCYVIREGK